MNTKFKKEIKNILKHGRKELKKTGGIQIKAYIFGDNETILTPVACSDNPLEKRLEIGRVRTISEASKAKCVVFLSDSFMNQNKTIHPSLDPNRKEVICLNGEDENGKFIITQEYVRRSNNRIRLGKIKSGRDDLGGLMVEEPFGVCKSD